METCSRARFSRKHFYLTARECLSLDHKGIFKPRVLSEVPLSITTAPRGPYDDAFGPDGLLRYRYRGTDPTHVDNRGLRFAMARRLPLVYFHGVVPGKYLATWLVLDGPTLAHAIQALHGSTLVLPRRTDSQPARELLMIRYERFRQASIMSS